MKIDRKQADSIIDSAVRSLDTAVTVHPGHGFAHMWVYVQIVDSTVARMLSNASFRARGPRIRRGEASFGYDESNGVRVGRANAFAASLKASGVACYVRTTMD